MTFVVFALVIALAAANGANDDPKGIATLAGAGTARIRTALAWGVITTMIGALLSYFVAHKMTALFSKGIVSASPTAAFAAAVLTGTLAWVAFATFRRLPVSTTHALTGSLIGAGLLFAPASVHWKVLLTKAATPLLLSVVAAVAISAVLSAVARRLARADRTQPRTSAASPRSLAETSVPDGTGGGAAAPRPAASTATLTKAATSPVMAGRPKTLQLVTVAHWLTSGFASLSRGLNDTPKIAAIGSFAMLPGLTGGTEVAIIATAMAVGGMIAGRRVAGRLAHDVVRMTHHEGFTANLTTAGLVALGAFRGMPMSTTHVSTGAIGGLAGSRLGRLNGATLRDFAVAWLVTPPFAGAIAALAYLALR